MTMVDGLLRDELAKATADACARSSEVEALKRDVADRDERINRLTAENFDLLDALRELSPHLTVTTLAGCTDTTQKLIARLSTTPH